MADQAPTAASPVWRTAELLKNILKRVDPVTLFLLRRTNKFFNQLINNSPALRKLLYLKPDDSVLQSLRIYASRGLRASVFTDTPWLDIITRDEEIDYHQTIGKPYAINLITEVKTQIDLDCAGVAVIHRQDDCTVCIKSYSH